jgi:hypothetical protein
MTVIHEDPSIPPLLANPKSFVVDPDHADTVEMELDLVSVAQPTAGPNRYTTHVPTEKTVLSLGAASGRWNTDKGITGYTDSHVHFETKSGSRTVVSLGGPATKSTLSGLGAKAPVHGNGYSMVTLQNAWHDAKKQHYLLSLAKDVTLRTMGEGKRAVIQAVKGMVDLNGATEVNLAGGGVAIGAHQHMPFEDVEYAKNWHGETPHSLAAKRTAQFNTIAAAAVTAHNLATAAVATRNKFKDGKLHAEIDTFADIVEWGIDAAELYRAKGEIQELFAAEEAVENNIKIDAERDFGVSAGGEAAFFGIQGATLISTVWTSVSAVVSASLKGTLFAGVAAAYTSLKGYKKIEIGCDVGNALFDAARSVSITAEGNFIAVGKELAQVSGETSAYFAGTDSAWLGVTVGGGWGLLLDAQGVMIGKATSAGSMKSAKVEPDRSLKIDKKGFTLKSASSEVTLTEEAFDAKSKTVDLIAKSSELRVAGKKVLIDGP